MEAATSSIHTVNQITFIVIKVIFISKVIFAEIKQILTVRIEILNSESSFQSVAQTRQLPMKLPNKWPRAIDAGESRLVKKTVKNFCMIRLDS